MIIATAGHVDHGKTSLVHRLTGVDTDTLAEEKTRGLSINLGYAYLPCPGGDALGFIDVPGHRRFINNMIAGISGIDMGLLVVAADDGPMPQTTEHLDVLELLGVDRLTVAISKIDRVDQSRLRAVEESVRGLLTARPWTGTAIFPVSNRDGSGVPELTQHLVECSRQQRESRTDGGFRLSIDRSFIVKGAGLVVTGTASAGSVRVGDKLLLLPARREVRVRGLRAQDTAVESAAAGQRVALNLAGGTDATDIERGDWLVDPTYAQSSSRLDVACRLSPGAPFALKHLAPIKLYIGAKRVAGRLALVDQDKREGARRRLCPGETSIAQLILDKPVSAVWGEAFLLRDHAENSILGGGTVLDPDGPASGKARPERLTWLRAMQAATAEEALAQLLAQDLVVNLDRFWAIRNLPVPAKLALPAGCQRFESEGFQWAVTTSRWDAASRYVTERVADEHGRHPERPGIRMTELMAAATADFEAPLSMAVLVDQIRAGELELRDGHINRKGFQKRDSASARGHWQTLERHLRQCGLQVPPLSELLDATRIPQSDLKPVIHAATRSGELHRLNDNRYALSEHLLYFSERVLEAEKSGDALSVTGLKTHFRSGRKLTIEVLEYFDSIHFTRRTGDTRIVLNKETPRERFGGRKRLRKSDAPGGVPGLQNQ